MNSQDSNQKAHLHAELSIRLTCQEYTKTKLRSNEVFFIGTE